jgi:hypothetical protein
MLAILAAISGRGLVLPELAAKLHLAILRMMRFFVRTAYGVSPGFYGNAECLSYDLPGPVGSNSNLAAWFGDTVTRAYGVLQGSSNGPLSWNSVHLPAFQTLNALTPGHEIQSADNSIILSRKGDAFADDTNLWVSNNTITCTGLTPSEGLQQLAQRWHRVLRCTGGDLGLHKCFWTFVEFEWCNGRASYVPIADSPHTVLLRTNDSANLPPTPYQTVQGALWAKRVALGDRHDKENVFAWSSVELHLPGSSGNDPARPWISMRPMDGRIASDIHLYVDDNCETAATQELAWRASSRMAKMCACWLGLQDAARKRREPSVHPRAWAGSVVHVEDDAVYKLVTQEQDENQD